MYFNLYRQDFFNQEGGPERLNTGCTSWEDLSASYFDLLYNNIIFLRGSLCDRKEIVQTALTLLDTGEK